MPCSKMIEDPFSRIVFLPSQYDEVTLPRIVIGHNVGKLIHNQKVDRRSLDRPLISIAGEPLKSKPTDISSSWAASSLRARGPGILGFRDDKVGAGHTELHDGTYKAGFKLEG